MRPGTPRGSRRLLCEGITGDISDSFLNERVQGWDEVKILVGDEAVVRNHASKDLQQKNRKIK